MSELEKVPETDIDVGAAVKGKMLPGVAAITVYLALFTIARIIFSLSGSPVSSRTLQYGLFFLDSLLAIGLYGQMRMRRWGWSIVLAGCLMQSASFLYRFSLEHQPASMIQGLFNLLFFLYLVRPEVRDRMV